MANKLPDGFSHPLLIGEGSFSFVYRVRQESLKRWAVLKVLKPDGKSERDKQMEEAGTLAGIKLQGIPEIYDVFVWKEHTVLVMEWIEGVSLAAFMNRSLSRNEKNIFKLNKEVLRVIRK